MYLTYMQTTILVSFDFKIAAFGVYWCCTCPGLIQLLLERERHWPEESPLTIVGPNKLFHWLKGYNARVERIKFNFVQHDSVLPGIEPTDSIREVYR